MQDRIQEAITRRSVELGRRIFAAGNYMELADQELLEAILYTTTDQLDALKKIVMRHNETLTIMREVFNTQLEHMELADGV